MQFTRKIAPVAIMSGLVIHLAGCASTSIGGDGRTTSFDRAVQNCIGSLVVGTIGGAVLGAAVGGGNRRTMGQGAVIGAAAGGVACAVMMAVANEEDKARVLANERAAIASGAPRVESYQREGVSRRVETKVYDSEHRPLMAVAAAPPPPAKKKAAPKQTAAPKQPAEATIITASVPTDQKICRYAETTIEVQGQGTTTTDKQMYCRNAAGDWEPTAVPV